MTGLLGIATGVCLTLFGMRFLRKGLDRLFGGSLFRWLSRFGDAFQRVLRTLEIATGLLTTLERSEARALVQEKHDFNEWARELQRQHFERLPSCSPEQLASSSYFVDVFNALRRINSHLSTIGYSFLPPGETTASAETAR